MSDRLIADGTVITMDRDRRVLAGGAVAVRDGRIAEVGPSDELRARHADLPLLDARGGIVLPGLIDAHGHAGHSFTRTLGAGRPGGWGRVCEEVYARAATDELWALDALLLGADRLRSGVTCGVSFLGGGGQILTGDMALRTDTPDAAAAHLQAVAGLGVRETLVVGPRRPPFPRRYVRHTADGPIEIEVSFADQLAVCEQVARAWHGAAGGRLRVAFTAHTVNPGSGGDDAAGLAEQAAHAREVLAAARRHGLQFMQDGHTTGTVAHAHEAVGPLGPDVLLSHATELTAEEIALCARTGATVVHNPSAVASTLGRCPVPELLDAGARVVVGSDAAGPDRGADLLRHLFVALRLQRAAFRDPDLLPEGKALEMVTVDAADALGLGDELGSLEAGKRGDIVVLDADSPGLTPLLMPVHQLVGYASAADVRTVLVEGRPVLEERRVTTVDLPAALRRAREVAGETLERAGLADELEPAPGFWGRARVEVLA